MKEELPNFTEQEEKRLSSSGSEASTGSVAEAGNEVLAENSPSPKATQQDTNELVWPLVTKPTFSKVATGDAITSTKKWLSPNNTRNSMIHY